MDPSATKQELDEELIGALFGELDDALDAMRSTADEVLEKGAFEDSINAVFRRVHSIKSNLRMVFVDDLADYTHDVENLLTDIREGIIEAPPAFFPMLFLVMTEICELAKTSLTGGSIDEAVYGLAGSGRKTGYVEYAQPCRVIPYGDEDFGTAR